jgi:hypothetical protein
MELDSQILHLLECWIVGLFLRCSLSGEKFGYKEKIEGLRSGKLDALVSDGSQLEFIANNGSKCDLHVLKEDLGAFNMAFAFRANFTKDYPDSNLIADINTKLLSWAEEGDQQVRRPVFAVMFL